MITHVLVRAGWDYKKRKFLFEICEDVSVNLPDGKVLIIPSGYITDFASIPWWFRSVISSLGKHSIAALVHDFLYDQRIGTRMEADKIFLKLMLHYNVTKAKAYVMYWGVRIGGRSWWID